MLQRTKIYLHDATVPQNKSDEFICKISTLGHMAADAFVSPTVYHFGRSDIHSEQRAIVYDARSHWSWSVVSSERENRDRWCAPLRALGGRGAHALRGMRWWWCCGWRGCRRGSARDPLGHSRHAGQDTPQVSRSSDGSPQKAQRRSHQDLQTHQRGKMLLNHASAYPRRSRPTGFSPVFWILNQDIESKVTNETSVETGRTCQSS